MRRAVFMLLTFSACGEVSKSLPLRMRDVGEEQMGVFRFIGQIIHAYQKFGESPKRWIAFVKKVV